MEKSISILAKWQSTNALPFIFTIQFELLRSKTTVELLNTTLRSDVTLLTRIERMAIGAYVYAERIFSRSGLKSIAATALHLYFMVFRMYSLLH